MYKWKEGLVMRKSILGQKFGTLTVVEYIGVENKNSYWVCQCDCGNKVKVCRTALRQHSYCSRNCEVSSDSCSIKGNKYGRLTILNLDHMKNGTSYWKCICDCGCELVIKRGHITDGRIRSCGCIRRGKLSSHWTGCGDISGSFFSKVKGHAKRRKIHFDIEVSFLWELFLKQNKKCALTDLPLCFSLTNLDVQNASLDRINSSVGYIDGNVQWVHKDINFMKQQFEQEHFISFCKLVSNKFN